MKRLEDEYHFFPAEFFKDRTEEKAHHEHAEDVYPGSQSLKGTGGTESLGIFGGDADEHIKHHGVAERSYEAEDKSTGEDRFFVHRITPNAVYLCAPVR